jgi:hypothetical protein
MFKINFDFNGGLDNNSILVIIDEKNDTLHYRFVPDYANCTNPVYYHKHGQHIQIGNRIYADCGPSSFIIFSLPETVLLRSHRLIYLDEAKTITLLGQDTKKIHFKLAE